MSEEIKVPALGESITEAEIGRWLVEDGQTVEVDQPICELETDKAAMEVPSPQAGVLHHKAAQGDTVNVGDVIAVLEQASTHASPKEPSSKPPSLQTDAPQEPDRPSAAAPSSATSEDRGHQEGLSPSVRKLIQDHGLRQEDVPASGPRGRLLKSDVLDYLESQNKSSSQTPVTQAEQSQQKSVTAASSSSDSGRLVPMSRLRKTIAKRLVQAQHDAAMLTTFNEVDMTEIMALRAQYKEKFQKHHQVNLGFMSFFAKAVCQAAKAFPIVNASLEGDNVRYHDGVHLGIAVSTERGLVVPVLRNADKMSFADIEREIKDMAEAARLGKLGINDLSGGTFTITNGGVFGSVFSTPILNPPQSAILGMHAIQKRAMVMPDDSIKARPMMYLALSYDHRLVDGKESVSFLVRIKEAIENPTRILLDV